MARGHGRADDTVSTIPVCDAFPSGIPAAIIEYVVDHRQTYHGDRGLQFLPLGAPLDVQAAYPHVRVGHYPSISLGGGLSG